MTRFVIRVWLPDRPGALGRVASALGSVGASLVGIEILEQDGGYAIDELIVDAVESPNAAEKLTVALVFIEGVNVEEVRETQSPVIDSRVEALTTAAQLVEQDNAEDLTEVLVWRALHDMTADWAALVDHSGESSLAQAGDIPSMAWIAAFLAGSKSAQEYGDPHHGADDIAWTELPETKTALIVGRDGRPFRARERAQITALSRIADRRLSQLRD